VEVSEERKKRREGKRRGPLDSRSGRFEGQLRWTKREKGGNCAIYHSGKWNRRGEGEFTFIFPEGKRGRKGGLIIFLVAG